MSSLRISGTDPLGVFRINGQQINRIQQVEKAETVEAITAQAPISGTKSIQGVQQAELRQETAYTIAHLNAIRGEQALDFISGRKPKKRKKPIGNEMTDEAYEALMNQAYRVEAISSQKDRHHRQDRAYQMAAEFEEHIKAYEDELKFRRRSAQIQTGDFVYVAADQGEGAVISGESEYIMDFGDTVPNIVLQQQTKATEFSDTSLRRVLGLENKEK